MKKMLALVLVLCMCSALFGCASAMTPAEKFLMAVRKADFSAMKAELVSDEKVGSFYLKLQNMSALNEEATAALVDLYSLMEYTIEETSSEKDGVKTAAVKIKIPDMARILSLAEAQMFVSAASPAAIIGEMISNGSVQKTMKELSFTVKMTQTDGAWKIPYGDKENAELVKALALAELIDFMD